MQLTREQVREIDRRAIHEFGVPGIVLMENAGRGTAELLRKLGVVGEVIICCGKGNNGGDGLVIARHLDNWQIPVSVLLFADPAELAGDSAVNFNIVLKSKIPIQTMMSPIARDGLSAILNRADWLVDALFGTGLCGPLRSPFDQVVAEMNGSGKKILAVDIPSGLDANAGVVLGHAIVARHTATLVAPKTGFAKVDAQRFLGQIHIVDIGAPRILLHS